MQAETARILIQTLAESMNAAFAAHSKLTALEKVLRKHNLALYEEYQEVLAETMQNPPFVANPVAFANLQSKLAQDQTS